MNEPKHGDMRVREGHLEEYVVPPPRVGAVEEAAQPPQWPALDPTPGWKRRERVDGAREVRLYSVSFMYHDTVVTLAPNERVVSVEHLSGGSRCVWIEQEL